MEKIDSKVAELEKSILHLQNTIIQILQIITDETDSIPIIIKCRQIKHTFPDGSHNPTIKKMYDNLGNING